MGVDPVSAIVYIAIVAITVAAGAYASSKTESSKSAKEAEELGIKVNTRDTAEPIKVVYGQQQIGGNDVFYSEQGADNTILWVVQTLCEGPIEGIAQDAEDSEDLVYLDAIRQDEYGNKVEYWLHTGTGSQTYDTNLNAVEVNWTDAMRYTAYVVWKLTWDRDKFQALPKRTSVIKGRLLYDPRDGTTAYSNNPALAALDWLTNGRYGMGENMGSFNMDSFKSCANYCETKGWTINMAISKQDKKWDILNDILLLFRGKLIWNPEGGQYYLKYADLNYESSAMTVGDEHILQNENGVAAISVAQGSKLQKTVGYNVVFIDPDKNYTSDKIPVGDTIGKVEDLKLLGCTNRQQAADIGVYELERQLLDRIVNLTARDDCVQLEPHDVITLSSSSMALPSQLMRVVQAEIQQNGLIQMSLQYEALELYDDDYNIELADVYNVDISSPTDEPPPVVNVTITEQTYFYRLRTESKFIITFDQPDYVWFSHVEVWQSFDNSSWIFRFNAEDDFEIGPLEEGQTYYFRLKVVNIRGVKQADNNDYKISKLASGRSSTLPTSLTVLYIIMGRNNSLTLFSNKIADPDIEVYEFRLGSSWSGGIFMASLRAPNLVLNMVKPGQHTFFCNTLGTNDLYGANPVSASITLPDPPDDYTIQTTRSFNNLVTNGDMELASNWTGVNSPVTSQRSSERKHGENYSWKLVVDAAGEGIKSDSFSTVSGRKYGVGLFVFPDTCTSIHIRIRKGDGSAWSYDQDITGLTQDQWNEINFNFTEGGVSGGSGAYIEITSPTGETADTWYIDDVVILEGDFADNMAPVLYTGDAYIKCKHTGGDLSGVWYSPILDLGVVGGDTYLVYTVNDLLVTGQGTTWNSQMPSPTKWSEIGVTTRKWREIFELSSAPSVEMILNYGTASPPTSQMKKLEIMAAVLTTRYYQLKITITDPQLQVYAYVEGPNIKFAQ